MGTRRPSLLLLVAALASTIATAGHAQAPQQATVSGRITDAPTGQPLANAQVNIVGSLLGAQTNADGAYTTLCTICGPQTNPDGEYATRGVKAGTFELRALRVGYGEMRRSITVAAGQSASENFAMQPVPVSLNPVVTTATGQQARAEVGNDIAQVAAAKVVANGTVNNAADLLTAR